MENRFDALAKALADSVSRREALSRLGGGLAGLLLAAVGLGKAWGDSRPGPENSLCAQFCTAVFPPGPQRGQCINQAAQGGGLCVQCGANPNHICGTNGGQLF